MKIGAQLYTAHSRLTNLEDFDAGLGKVAEIGYKAVQVSGTCEYDPFWLRDALSKHDLICPLTHIAPQKLMDDALQVVNDHKVFGCAHIGIGGMPVEMRDTLEGYEKFRDTFLPIAKLLRDHGCKLMYHNHWFEFDKLDGKDVIERLLEDFPEDTLGFTLDLGWAAFAGKDVLALIEAMKGRLDRVHLKDYADMPADGSIDTLAYLRPIYEGKLDYTAYINALNSSGAEYAFVEQDWCYGEDDYERLKRSFDHVTSRFPDMK